MPRNYSMATDIKPGTIRYDIHTWQATYGAKEWFFCIRKFKRVIFKRSKVAGWRTQGFVNTNLCNQKFTTRAEALAAAKAQKAALR